MAELPEAFSEVRVLRPEPGDVLVLKFGEVVSPEDRDEAMAALETVFPLHKVMVIGPFDDLEVVRDTSGPAPTGGAGPESARSPESQGGD